MSCSKTVIEVDYVKYAEMFGFKNPGSGKATWNALKRKLKRMGEGDGAGGTYQSLFFIGRIFLELDSWSYKTLAVIDCSLC